MSDKKRIYHRWGIIGNCGLYVGQRLTRKDAITEHVTARYEGWPNTPPEAERERLWAVARRLGDRVVKLKIRIG